MGVHGLLTIWCAPCSAWPLLRIWYGNSREFCPKPHRRAAAAARSRPSRKPRPAWRAVLCAAWAASSPQGRAMAGQGRSPCGLGGYKRGHSSAENGPPLLCRGVRRKQRRVGAARGRVVDLGTATREMGGKAGYAENMSRAAAVNAQRERVLLFLFLPFAIPFRRRGSDTPKRVKSDYRR